MIFFEEVDGVEDGVDIQVFLDVVEHLLVERLDADIHILAGSVA